MAHDRLSGNGRMRALAALFATALAALAAIGAASSNNDHPLRAASHACAQHAHASAHACAQHAHASSHACGHTCSGPACHEPVPLFCYDPDHPPSQEMLDWVQSLFGDGTDYQIGGQWGPAGQPITLTWSLVPDGTSLPGPGSNQPSQMFSRMNQLFGNNQAFWISLVEECFDRWSELSGVTFVRVTHGTNEWDDGASFPSSPGSSSRGDIRIGMRPIDGSGGVLAFAYLPSSGGDIVMDSAENWAHSSNNRRFMRNTLMHEIGHSLGLLHCCPNNGTKLLNPGLSTSFDGPQHDDVRGIHALYGDFYSPNHNINIAAELGTLNLNQTLRPSTAPAPGFGSSSITSIDRLQDNDAFAFNVNDPMEVTVTVTPVGHSYSIAPQLQSGACGSATTVNSRNAAALAVQVFGPNNLTLLGTADSNPPGVAESVTVQLTEPGEYYVRVYATSVSSVQLYSLEIASSAPSICPTFTVHPQSISVCSGAALVLVAEATGSPAPTYQWRRNGNNIAGATSNVFEISSVNIFTPGTYDVVATNSCGSVTSEPAEVTIGPPNITQHPEDLTVPLGSQATFTVNALGSPAPQFRWTLDGNPISGGTSGTLVIQSVSSSDVGIYRAEAYNSCGGNFSDTATLSIEGGCYADCDDNGFLNIDDFVCFINAFSGQEPYADCDGNGIFNIDDFVCFINEFAQGCP